MIKKILYIACIALFLSGVNSLFIPKFHKPIRFSNEDKARKIIETVMTALVELKKDTSVYPNSPIGLTLLYERSETINNWDGPYLRRRIPEKDQMGGEWIYRYPHDCDVNMDHFAFYSVGKNGIDECMGGDDIYIEIGEVLSDSNN